jgi:hypothetical protein
VLCCAGGLLLRTTCVLCEFGAGVTAAIAAAAAAATIVTLLPWLLLVLHGEGCHRRFNTAALEESSLALWLFRVGKEPAQYPSRPRRETVSR